MSEGGPACSFCGQQSPEIIAGPNVYICFDCVERCVEIIRSTPTSRTNDNRLQHFDPPPSES